MDEGRAASSGARPEPRIGLRCSLLVLSILLSGSLLWRGEARSLSAGGAAPAVLAQATAVDIHLPLLLRSNRRVWATALPAPPTAPSLETPEATASPAVSPTPSSIESFGLVRLAPELVLEGSGDIIDSIAFWEAPDAADSLMLVTAKGNQRVEIWQQPFVDRELPALEHPSFGSGTQVNGIVVDQAQDLAYVAVSRPASTVAIFSLPDLSFRGQLVAGEVDLRSEPNLALLTGPDGGKRLYVSADDRVYIYDPASGAALGAFEPAMPLETMLADDFDQLLYIPDENDRSGVYAYQPDGSPFSRGGEPRFGGDGIFEADAEGITAFNCPAADPGDSGRGWLIVADQKRGASDFEFFDRQSWAHLGRLQLDGVAFTDGIASTQQALPRHPAGLFAAVNDDRGVALVGWDRIFEATGLSCEDGATPDPPR